MGIHQAGTGVSGESRRSGPHPTDLRADFARTPAIVASTRPELTWRSTAAPAAFQLWASSTPEKLAAGEPDLWDSGRREVSAGRFAVSYDGRDLHSGEHCWWTVRLWGDGDVEGGWALPARFEVPPLEPSDWRAEWITWPVTRDAGALYFWREFGLSRPVRTARLHGAAVGWGEFWLNGSKVGTAVLDPAQTDENVRVLFSTYDVTSLLRAGENVIGAVVAHGWSNDRAVVAQLEVEHDDGSTTTVVTGRVAVDDPIWLVGAGPITDAGVFDGERYDARREHDLWTVPGADPWGPMRPLGHAHAARRPTSVLVPQVAEPIEVVQTLSMDRLAAASGGAAVFDAGRNVAGWCRIRVRGRRGQVVRLRFAETLREDGSVDQDNLRSGLACDEYTLRGDREEVWEPRFTCHGFRFVQVETDATLAMVEARVVRSAMARAAEFSCSDELVQAISDLVVNTEEANLVGVPTDCPQRDERMGWVNDMTARAEELVYTFDASRFLAKWMDDIADTQRADGAIADTAPFRLGVRPADPVAMSYPLIPWLLYTHYGDRRTMERHHHGLVRWADHLSRGLVDGVLPTSYYGDWAPPAEAAVGGEPGGSALSAGTPGGLVSTAHYAGSLDLLLAESRVLGDDEGDLPDRLVQARGAFHRAFWNGRGYASGNQASNAIALYFDMVPQQHVAATVAALVDAVERAERHLTTGNLATKYLLEVLCRHGRVDLAYEIVSQRTYPGWGYMLGKGATTIWERWEYITGGGMNSHNHAMFASVGSWLHRRLAGVRLGAHAVGFSEVDIDPAIPQGLRRASTTIQTVRGPLFCGWCTEDGRVRLTLDLPPGCSARVLVPAADPTRSYTGSHEFAWSW